MVDDRKQIEEVINIFHDVNSKCPAEEILTKDFEFVDLEGQILTLKQMIAPSPFDNVEIHKNKIDYISRLEISNDCNHAFIVVYVKSSGTVPKFFGPVDVDIFSIHSGYLRKVEKKWKIAFLQQSSRKI